MTIQILIAHAEGEENYAEELDRPIRDAGYQVVHYGTVMVGESLIEEASKILMTGASVVLCGTIRAIGTRWARRFVNAARKNNPRIGVFVVRMEQDADVEQLALGDKVAEYWRDPARAVQELIASLRKHHPLVELNKEHKQQNVPFMVEDLPENFVKRPDVFEPLIRCLLDEKREEPIAITAALRGSGGYGKTTIARALCHDKRVQQTFDDGILWVTFGERPGNLVNKIEELLYILNREKPSYTSLDAATMRLVELLADRNILLVLDDVWNSAHIKPFLQGGKRCARLITTRDERVVPSSVPLAQRIQVDAMQQDEAIQLLISGIQVFEEKDLLKQYNNDLKRLATRLGEWPLLLMLARSVLHERITLYMQDVSRAMTAIHRTLDKRGVTAFDQSNAIERSQAVAKTIGVSLELLQPEERKRYQELAIFPEDIDIPLQTLQKVWISAGGLDEFDTEDLCIRLRSLSLLLHYNSVAQTVRLHDVMRSYLQKQYTPTELAQLHVRFLDAYPVKRWADLPENEPYLWSHLATHIIAASRASELITTVMDGAYLTSKAAYRPVSLLEQDLELAIEHNSDNPALNPTLRRLQHSITNMGHILHTCENWQECASVLHSRLVHSPEFQSICQTFEHQLNRPYLTPWHSLPDLPMSVQKRTLTGHTGGVYACAISPDGTWILSASEDGSLKIWDVTSGKLRHTLVGHTKPVRACAISPDGSWLLSGSSDCTLKIWDVVSGKLRHTLTGHTKPVKVCAISPDGSWFLSGSSDCTLKIWEAVSGKLHHTLTGHSGGVYTCAISPDGTWILSASEDRSLRIWDAASGKLLHGLPVNSAGIYTCAISPNGSWLLYGTRDERLRIWDVTSGKLRHTLAGHTKPVRACAISPDGSWLLSGSNDGTLMIWGTASGKLRHILAGHTKPVRACAISPDGSWLLSGSSDCTLRIWNAVVNEYRSTPTGHTKPVRACAISPDGSWLLSGSSDCTLKIWEAVSGKLHHTLTGHSGGVHACAIGPDGSWLLSASEDSTLKIWDATSGKLRQTFTGHTKPVRACSISPDGSWFLSASNDGTLKIWEAVSGKIRQTLSEHTDRVVACAISPDGSWLLSASEDNTLKIWEVSSGKIRHTLIGHSGGVHACAISPDGSWLLSASEDNTLKIWDATSGKLRQTFTGHTKPVRACSISPDGSWMLSASEDGTLKIWDIATKIYIATLHVNGALYSCLFYGNRFHIVAGGEGGFYFLRVVDDG